MYSNILSASGDDFSLEAFAGELGVDTQKLSAPGYSHLVSPTFHLSSSPHFARIQIDATLPYHPACPVVADSQSCSGIGDTKTLLNAQITSSVYPQPQAFTSGVQLQQNRPLTVSPPSALPSLTNPDAVGSKRKRRKIKEEKEAGTVAITKEPSPPRVEAKIGESPSERQERLREASRIYRKRKKAYIEELEQKVAQLTQSNEQLVSTCASQKEELSRLDWYKTKHGVLIALQDEYKVVVDELDRLLQMGALNYINDIETLTNRLDVIQDQLDDHLKHLHIFQLDFSSISSSLITGVNPKQPAPPSPVTQTRGPPSPSSGDCTDLKIWAALEKRVEESAMQGDIISSAADLRSHLAIFKQRIYKSSEEMQNINARLLQWVREEFQRNSILNLHDMSTLVNLSSSLSEIRNTLFEQWDTFSRSRREFFSKLNPVQRAWVLVARTKLTEGVMHLNAVWRSLNKQTSEGNPTVLDAKQWTSSLPSIGAPLPHYLVSPLYPVFTV